MISAAHTFGRLTGSEVYITQCQDVVACYSDKVLRPGKRGVQIHLEVSDYHREKNGDNFVNYLGTFVRPLLPFHSFPVDFELPPFPQAERRCLLQPFAKTARNPSTDWLQTLVDTFCKSTGETLYAVGRTDTPRVLRNVDYSLLANGLPSLLRHVANAKCMLTPRSASAHIAAAYKVPALIWLPDDNENWHLNYNPWKRLSFRFTQSSRTISQLLEEFSIFLGQERDEPPTR